MLKCNTHTLFSEHFLPEIKLRELDVRSAGMEPTSYENLNLFLKTQRETLETLCLDITDGHETWKTILTIPRLKLLSYQETDDVNPIEITDPAFQPKLSVENLVLHNFRSDHSIRFLQILPKVKFLRILNLTDEVAELISKTCKSLTHLEVYHFSAKNIANESFFLNLKTFGSLLEIVDPIIKTLFEKLGGKSIK